MGSHPVEAPVTRGFILRAIMSSPFDVGAAFSNIHNEL